MVSVILGQWESDYEMLCAIYALESCSRLNGFPSPIKIKYFIFSRFSHTHTQRTARSGLEVIKHFSCSTQLSMNFFPLIDVKMPTIVGILTCMSGKNNILGLT